ncbi:hypothetical protein EV361DRAFT_897263 [Lentinula raphanica]|nr:hypothetical protein EV361DRAFT_897263 [Lentinula raphanica]
MLFLHVGIPGPENSLFPLTIISLVEFIFLIFLPSYFGSGSIIYLHTAMPGNHLALNQHAVHHVHARFMSNVAIGPGGQATFVAPTQPASSIAFAASVSTVNVASATLQSVFSSPSAATAIVNSPTLIISPSASSTPSSLVEVSTTVVVTSEVVEATTNSMSSSSSTIPGTTSSSGSISTATTSIASATSSMASSSSPPLSTMSSSSTTSPSSLAASATSSATTTASTKEPTLYIGIVLGTIIVIACCAALIAWWLRIRTHNRRRKKNVAVPWANRPGSSLSSFADSDSLEKGGASDSHQCTWEPRGDRDVGEPKRSMSYFQELTTPVKRQSVPILSVPSPPPPIYPYYSRAPPRYPNSHASSCSLPSISPASIAPLQESVAYPLPSTFPPANFVQPSRNVHPDPPSVRMQFLTDPEFGTPRESMIKPRYLSLDEGLEVPWKLETPVLNLEPSYLLPPAPSGNVQVDHSSSPHERHPQVQEKTPTDTLPPSVSEDPSKTWSSSIKANLMYAFNAVTKVSGAQTNEEYDKLSPLPSRNTSRIRKNGARNGGAPIPETGWVEYLGGELVGKAPTLVESPTLEETSAGRGIVHINTEFSNDGPLPYPGTVGSSPTSLHSYSCFGTGMGLESYRGNDHAFSPLPSLPSSIASSRQPSITSYKSTAALNVRKKNTSMRSFGTTRSSASGLNRNLGSQRRPRYAYGGEMAAGSRRGSVLSDVPRLPALPSFSRSKSGSGMSVLSRLSTMRSMKSTRSIMTVLTDREEMARKALMERQRRGNVDIRSR